MRKFDEFMEELLSQLAEVWAGFVAWIKRIF
jgi:hypothetical protein